MNSFVNIYCNVLDFYNNVRDLQERKNEIISEEETIFISKNISSRKKFSTVKNDYELCWRRNISQKHAER